MECMHNMSLVVLENSWYHKRKHWKWMDEWMNRNGKEKFNGKILCLLSYLLKYHDEKSHQLIEL